MKKLEEIIAQHFKLSPEDMRGDLSAEQIPEWDSMNYLLFVADVEKEYGISFTMDEVLGMKSLGDIRTALRGKGIDI
jgi:acyl carrier protein